MMHEFHEQYVEEMLICGVDKPGTPLDKIKMTKNPNYDLGYYKKIVGGIQKFEPFCRVVARLDCENTLADMSYIYLNNNKDVEGIFLLQNVYNWDGKNLFSAQVWAVKNMPEHLINQYWSIDHV